MSALARRIERLEASHKAAGGRKVHLIKAADTADSDRQIAELQAAGKVGPRDGFLSLTGWAPIH